MKKTKCKCEIINGHKFYTMREPLKFDVRCRNGIDIPAGTRNVKIAFRASWITYRDDNGNMQHMNIYYSNGKFYHGC